MKNKTAKFLEGSIFKHIITMTLMAMIGLMTKFSVQFIDMFFLSSLNNQSVISGLGFGEALLFVSFSIGLGIMIAASAKLGFYVGAKNLDKAKRLYTHITIVAVLISLILVIILMIFAPIIISKLGAKGITLQHAINYTRIILCSYPFIMLSMTGRGALRATGNIKLIIISAVITNLIDLALDPILIIKLQWGLEGAGLSTAIANFIGMFIILYPTHKKYHMFHKVVKSKFLKDIKEVSTIAIPTTLTQLATPISGIIITKYLGQYGDNAMAGYTVISRTTMIAYGFVFAISGSIAPIIAQNLGNNRIDRIIETTKKAVITVVLSAIIITLLLTLLFPYIADQFKLQAEGRELLRIFCYLTGYSYAFHGITFCFNSLFNNTHKPIYSTYINAIKSTIGIFILVFIFNKLYGVNGIIIATAVSGIIFSLVSVILGIRQINSLKRASTKQN